jgi:hypothetical protein
VSPPNSQAYEEVAVSVHCTLLPSFYLGGLSRPSLTESHFFPGTTPVQIKSSTMPLTGLTHHPLLISIRMPRDAVPPRVSLLFCVVVALCLRDGSADYCVAGQRCVYHWWSDDCYDCPVGFYTFNYGQSHGWPTVGSCETKSQCDACPAGYYNWSPKSGSCVTW